jgi:hypothetical protein
MNDDETFVGPATPENARRLLGLAKKAGLPVAVVRSQQGGFLVPTSILEGEGDEPSPPAKKAAKKAATSTKE